MKTKTFAVTSSHYRELVSPTFDGGLNNFPLKRPKFAVTKIFSKVFLLLVDIFEQIKKWEMSGLKKDFKEKLLLFWNRWWQTGTSIERSKFSSEVISVFRSSSSRSFIISILSWIRLFWASVQETFWDRFFCSSEEKGVWKVFWVELGFDVEFVELASCRHYMFSWSKII